MAFRIIQPNYISGGGGGGSTLLTGLVSWWDLTADGTDAHASNDLSAVGSPSFGTVDGYACVTTSSGNHLYNPAPTGTGLDTFTIAAWIRVTAPANNLVVVQCGDGSLASSIRYCARAPNDNLRCYVSNGSTNQTVDALNCLPANTWTLAIWTYDSSTGDMAVYADDGTANASGPSGFTTLNATQTSIGIGGDGDGTGSTAEFAGGIKSVGIWSRVITSDERTELWNSGVPLVYADL